MALTSDCTKNDIQLKTDQNNFNEYLLNTTSRWQITPRVPSNLTYRIKNCPINDILKKYIISTNELLYQFAKRINLSAEHKKNEVNVLLNKGILNNGQIRDNINAEIAVLHEALADMKIQFDIYETSNNKLVDKLEMDISKVSTKKLNVNKLDHIKRQIRKIISKTNKKFKNRWILLQIQLQITFLRADSVGVIFANTPAEFKLAIIKAVKTIQKLQRKVELDFENAENQIMQIIHGAEQKIVNVTQTICVDLMKFSQ